MTKLFIATPMYGGMCTGFYTQSILQLQNLAQSNNLVLATSFMFNESLIQRARNALAHNFMNSDFTHMMFIDADISFNPADVMSMLLADKDVICGIYPKKEINWYMVDRAVKAGVPHNELKLFSGSHVVNLIDNVSEATFKRDEPAQILNGGTGFMLIKRRVFEELAPHVPSYVNNTLDLSGKLPLSARIHEFFSTHIEEDTGILLSEDYEFCRKWRAIGGTIWAAPWARLAHVGTHIFDGSLSPALPQGVSTP
jgi:hypothetical protein